MDVFINWDVNKLDKQTKRHSHKLFYSIDDEYCCWLAIDVYTEFISSAFTQLRVDASNCSFDMPA